MSPETIDEICTKLGMLREAAAENASIPGEWLTDQLDEILAFFDEA